MRSRSVFPGSLFERLLRVTRFGVFAFLPMLYWNPQLAFAPIVPAGVLPSFAAVAEAHPAVTLVGKPRLLSIPRTGIAASIQDVAVLPDGKLDVPSDRHVLGWYSASAPPGTDGTAVIDGHLNTPEGDGAFWRLRDVRPGDAIVVTDEAGNAETFRVRETAVYDVEHAPLQKIFGDASGTHLNLITCAGVWSKRLNHYDKRLVVYADLVAPARAGITSL